MGYVHQLQYRWISVQFEILIWLNIEIWPDMFVLLISAGCNTLNKNCIALVDAR